MGTSLYSTLLLPTWTIGAPLMALLGLGCLIWCRGKDRKHLTRTAIVFCSAGVVLIGGELVGNLFGVTWRNLPVILLCAVMLFSGIFGIWFTLACFLPLELKDLAPILRRTAKASALIFGAMLVFYALTFGTLVAVLGFVGEEQVVVYEGQKLLEEEDGWLDTVYDYYEYHGPLFRGRERLFSTTHERLQGIEE